MAEVTIEPTYLLLFISLLCIECIFSLGILIITSKHYSPTITQIIRTIAQHPEIKHVLHIPRLYLHVLCSDQKVHEKRVCVTHHCHVNDVYRFMVKWLKYLTVGPKVQGSNLIFSCCFFVAYPWETWNSLEVKILWILYRCLTSCSDMRKPKREPPRKPIKVDLDATSRNVRRPERNLELPMSPIGKPSTLTLLDSSTASSFDLSHFKDLPKVSTQRVPHPTVLQAFGPPPRPQVRNEKSHHPALDRYQISMSSAVNVPTMPEAVLPSRKNPAYHARGSSSSTAKGSHYPWGGDRGLTKNSSLGKEKQPVAVLERIRSLNSTWERSYDHEVHPLYRQIHVYYYSHKYCIVENFRYVRGRCRTANIKSTKRLVHMGATMLTHASAKFKPAKYLRNRGAYTTTAKFYPRENFPLYGIW